MVPNKATKYAYKGPALPRIEENAIKIVREHLKAPVTVAPYLVFEAVKGSTIYER